MDDTGRDGNRFQSDGRESTPTERCGGCCRDIALEWFPAVICVGKPLPGTAQWRSQLINGLCDICRAAKETTAEKNREDQQLRIRLVELFGGERPFRDFTFERFRITPGNRLAFLRAKNFNTANDSLYLWGPSQAGKTHLAYAIARKAVEQDRRVEILSAWQLVRKTRMKAPDEEQGVIDRLIQIDVFVLEELGIGMDTVYARQILQEILDARSFKKRAGLVVTSKFSPEALARKFEDNTIPSRLAEMCQCIQISSPVSPQHVRPDV